MKRQLATNTSKYERMIVKIAVMVRLEVDADK